PSPAASSRPTNASSTATTPATSPTSGTPMTSCAAASSPSSRAPAPSPAPPGASTTRAPCCSSPRTAPSNASAPARSPSRKNNPPRAPPSREKMSSVPPDLLCIDIGNTHVHFATRRDGAFTPVREMPTALLADPAAALARLLPDPAHPAPPLAFCSVVPEATARLRALAASAGLDVWQLTHDQNLGLPVTYPRPAEIGQDRLANA